MAQPMVDTVRVRYAPSPTGEPHVGNVRTAIFNWLFARHHGGTFVIRVEDTDQARMVKGSTENLLDALRWLGLDWDEGPDIGGTYAPYHQSKRLELYNQAVTKLLEEDQAYQCYCSTQRLAEMRNNQVKLKEPPGYDRHCRNLTASDRNDLEKNGLTPVVRFKMPVQGVTIVSDLVRGKASFENRLVDDFVMLKSDGFPTYHLANVVDDHHMDITHVMRAEEWLPSTPRHLQLYRALCWQPPRYAHLPIILAPDKSKLSKRHGATSVLDYREMGYVPEAIVNFLTLMGWSLDDKTEIVSVEDLIKSFTIERVGKAGAVFNSEKLEWMNGYYIRLLPTHELAQTILDYWASFPPKTIPEPPDKAHLVKIVPLIQERMKTLRDAEMLTSFFFTREVPFDESLLVQKGMSSDETKNGLDAAWIVLSRLDSFDAESIEGVLRPLADDLCLKPRQLFGALRGAITGMKVSPPLFQSMEILGKEQVLVSIRKASDSV